jgi:four helix bundle protein
MELEHLKLADLEIYRKSITLSRQVWKIYTLFNWQDQKMMGDQFVRAVDSIGANVAEGYGRFHYLDRIRFYYNARGSLLETKHWLFLLKERNKISQLMFDDFIKKLNSLHYKLNSFIKNIKKAKYPK